MRSLRAGHARLACEVNRNGGQQRRTRRGDSAKTLDTVGIPSL